MTIQLYFHFRQLLNRLLSHSGFSTVENNLTRLLLGVCFALSLGTCFAGPLLQCDVTYAGKTHKLKAVPQADPYAVKLTDIGGRFFFKMVLTEVQSKLDHVLIYAYLDQKPRPVLLQEAKYFGPFTVSDQAYSLTGEQHLYGGPVERELIYNCWLLNSSP